MLAGEKLERWSRNIETSSFGNHPCLMIISGGSPGLSRPRCINHKLIISLPNLLIILDYDPVLVASFLPS